MATKTIALEISVYDKLLGRKRNSESFTKTIDRLISESAGSRTCAEAVANAAKIWGDGTDAEARAMEDVIRAGRENTRWGVEPLE
jgi:predicted CopG family antitoxin